MRPWAPAAALLALLCACSGNTAPSGTGSPAATPIGLMLASPGLSTPQEIDLARSLGATYFRPQSAIFLDQWRGTCADCALATAAGMKLVLTVSTGRTLGEPAAPPADLQAYRREVGDVLARVRPAVLSVENEENSALFYVGSPEEYGAQLRAACDMAHAQAIPCTNGGLVSTLVALLVYYDYLDSNQSARAADFAQRAFSPAERALLGSPAALAQLDRGRRLLRQYGTAGVDLVNFHWYIADAAALSEAVAYLQRAAGKPPMTNEIGQHDQEPATVTMLLARALELRMPYVVWYSIDSPQAFALTNPDGTLRPAGVAFRDFMRAHGWIP